MPNTAGAKKRLRQDAKRLLRNRAAKRTIKTQLRKVTEALSAGDVATSEQEFRVAARKLDQAAAKGVLHANAAGRTKSRFSARIKAAKAGT